MLPQLSPFINILFNRHNGYINLSTLAYFSQINTISTPHETYKINVSISNIYYGFNKVLIDSLLSLNIIAFAKFIVLFLPFQFM